MSDEGRKPMPELILNNGTSCELDAEGHCVTCSDEALPAKVLSIDEETGLALVEVKARHPAWGAGNRGMMKRTTEEIDITLVDSVSPGDMLLVHGGVAIGLLDEASNA